MTKNVNFMSLLVLWILVWVSGYMHTTLSEVSTKQVFYLADGSQKVCLPYPTLSSANEYEWLWNSYEGKQSNISIVTIRSNNWRILKTDVFSKGSGKNLCIEPLLYIAGEYVFTQTRPTTVLLARLEVFALKWNPFQLPLLDLGSDVSLSCQLPHMPEASTLQWETKAPTSNTTLFYNKTAYIILHNIDQNQRYNCVVRLNGTSVFESGILLNVRAGTFRNDLTLYREGSNSSKVDLICKTESSGKYKTAEWTRTTSSQSTPLVLASSGEFSKRFQKDSFLSPAFNGFEYPMHISPVLFEDGGRYACRFESVTFVLINLITIKVSASLHVGGVGDQPMVLTCELSELDTVPLTLAWLRREGSGVLMAHQKNLTNSKMLNVTLPSLHRDQLFWECVVFSNGQLRARVLLDLSARYKSTLTTPSLNAENSSQSVIIAACSVLLLLGILTAVLLLYCRGTRGRETAPRAVEYTVHSLSLPHQDDPVYGNITHTPTDKVADNHENPAEGVDTEDIHYSSFTLSGLKPREPDERDTKTEDCDMVIYSAVNVA